MTEGRRRLVLYGALGIVTLAAWLSVVAVAIVRGPSLPQHKADPPVGAVAVSPVEVASPCRAARITSSVHHEVRHDVFIAMPFTDAIRDSGRFWDPAQPTRLTAPSDGDYLIGGTVAWHHHENIHEGVRNIGIRWSGQPGVSIADNEWVSTEWDGAYGLQEITTYHPLRAGDWVELVPYQWNTGGHTVYIEAKGGVTPALWMASLEC